MMETTLFLIFNHHITPEQEADARATLGVTRIVSLPDELQEMWSDIPPMLPELQQYLNPIRQWMTDEAAAGDHVLVQGDFGACFLMAGFAMSRGLVPIYSTTRREAQEQLQPDGSVTLTHCFRHHAFRKYGV